MDELMSCVTNACLKYEDALKQVLADSRAAMELLRQHLDEECFLKTGLQLEELSELLVGDNRVARDLATLNLKEQLETISSYLTVYPNSQPTDQLALSSNEQGYTESDTPHRGEVDSSEEPKMPLSQALAYVDLNRPELDETKHKMDALQMGMHLNGKEAESEAVYEVASESSKELDMLDLVLSRLFLEGALDHEEAVELEETSGA